MRGTSAVHPITLLAVLAGLLGVGCGSNPKFALTISIQGDGTVDAAPGGSCTGPKTCPAITVDATTKIVLSGAPAVGWVAKTWVLDVDGANVTLPVDANGTVTVDGSKGSAATVTVTFVTLGGPTDGGKTD